jgi:outer membrane protein OmpA-like peptidoglycan-associated protein
MRTELKSGEDGKYLLKLRSNYIYNVEIKNDAGDILLLDVLTIPLAENDASSVVKNYQINLPSDDLALQGQRIKVENLNLVKMQYKPSDSLTIAGIINDAGGIIEGAQVIIRTEESKEILLKTTTDEEGRYNFRFIPGRQQDYIVEVYKGGYLLNSIAVLYNEKLDFRGNELELKSTMVNSVDANTRLTEIKVGARQVLGGVYFEFNSARLLQESSIALDKLYQFLRENTSITMEVSGHTDNIGSPEVNKAISRQRAQAVVNYLVKKGIARRRLVAEGYGETQPIASNESALNGRDVNRRVEVTILSK